LSAGSISSAQVSALSMFRSSRFALKHFFVDSARV
jgi:hypothetical protein